MNINFDAINVQKFLFLSNESVSTQHFLVSSIGNKLIKWYNNSLHGKNDFPEVFKNLARYRSGNNFCFINSYRII